MLDDKRHATGDRIGTYTDYTTVSLWVPTMLYALIYTNRDDGEITRTEHGHLADARSIVLSGPTNGPARGS